MAARLADAERQRNRQLQAQAAARQAIAASLALEAHLADARAARAAALQTIDRDVEAAATRLAAAAGAQAQAEAELAKVQAGFAALLPLMLRLSRSPADIVLASPGPPGQALRGLLLTRGLAITLNRQAALLHARQDEAAATRAATRHEADVLGRQRKQQAARATALDGLVAQARDQVTQAEADGRDAALQVAGAAAQARTLRGAIAALDAAASEQAARAARQAAVADRHRQAGAAQVARNRQAAVTRPTLAASSGGVRLVAPVAGAMLRGFGAATEDGPAAGITYDAAGGAFVSSPCAGRVAFAAPFRSYGRLLILECGGGLDIVLAGLGSIAASPGHAVRAGEPLGRMLAAGRLYLELRAGGRAVDPAPFLMRPI